MNWECGECRKSISKEENERNNGLCDKCARARGRANMTVRELIERLLEYSNGDCRREVRATACKDAMDEKAATISITAIDDSSCCLLTIPS